MAFALFWIALACCLIAQVAITVAAARKPRPLETEGAVPLPHRAAEVAWSLVPAVMLAMVLLFTWNMLRLADLRREPPPAVVFEPQGM